MEEINEYRILGNDPDILKPFIIGEKPQHRKGDLCKRLKTRIFREVANVVRGRCLLVQS